MKTIIKSFIAPKMNYSSFFKLELARKCPYCNIAFNPEGCNLQNYHIEDVNHNGYLYTILYCPSCKGIFMDKFFGIDLDDHARFSHVEIIPHPSNTISFQPNICELSDRYCKIYNQAYIAEQNGLNEICGMGYRKALEILIKDFAIYNNPDKKDNIKTLALGRCIATYIENEKIKALARASSFLGNDETHYQKTIEGTDIEDLKAFINALETYINSEIEVKKAGKLIDKVGSNK